jgi:glycosyltransferase involved in cell wall biosynthesis
MSGFLAPPPSRGLVPGKRPSFSVLIPAHEAASTLPAALASVLEQSMPAWEIIVCDDGSTDGTADAARESGAAVTVVRKENGGGASALNRALTVATGEFVCVLDAYEPTRLQRLGDLAAARPDLDLMATDCWFERDGQREGTYFGSNPFPVRDQRDAALRSSPIIHGVMRRTRLVAIGGWREHLRVVYDWDCYLRMLYDGAACGVVAEPLMRYRLHDTSLSGDRGASLTERALWLAESERTLPLTEHQRALIRASIVTQARRAVRANIGAFGDDRTAANARLRTLAAEPRLGARLRLAAAAGAFLARRPLRSTSSRAPTAPC